eukprot:3469540-Rhodomonas_salina.2
MIPLEIDDADTAAHRETALETKGSPRKTTPSALTLQVQCYYVSESRASSRHTKPVERKRGHAGEGGIENLPGPVTQTYTVIYPATRLHWVHLHILSVRNLELHFMKR